MTKGVIGWLCTGLFGGVSLLDFNHLLQTIAIIGTIFASFGTGLYYLKNTFLSKSKKKRKK